MNSHHEDIGHLGFGILCERVRGAGGGILLPLFSDELPVDLQEGGSTYPDLLCSLNSWIRKARLHDARAIYKLTGWAPSTCQRYISRSSLPNTHLLSPNPSSP